MSFKRSTCGTERDINVLTNKCAGSCKQMQSDMITIVRYGPKNVEELVIKVDLGLEKQSMQPTSFLTLVIEKQIGYFGTGYHIRRIKRSDTCREHVGQEGTRTDITRQVNSSISCLLSSSARIDKQSIFDGEVKDFQADAVTIKLSFSQRFKEILAKYQSWRKKWAAEDHDGIQTRYKLTDQQKAVRRTKQLVQKQRAREAHLIDSSKETKVHCPADFAK